MAFLYPSPIHPYYIVAPPYERASAGVRCLHLLCHCLNTKGHTAYIVPEPSALSYGLANVIGTDLLTPYLTEEIANDHIRLARVPIVVYPEIVSGNPYNAACVVRYVLNFPGLLGGDKTYPPTELCFGYSAALAESTRSPENVLFIPPIDTRIFTPPKSDAKRSGGCFYADKYRKVHGGKPYPITDDCIEITRQQEGAQTTEEVAALLQRSEVFYAYENTALAIEAVLCGCPAVFIPNPYLDKVIASVELGSDGYAWGTDPAEIARAKATVAKGAKNYLALINVFWQQLDVFVTLTQAHAKDTAQPSMSFRFPTKAAEKIAETPAASFESMQAEVVLYPSLSYAFYLGIFRLFPALVEREFAKFCSSIGFKTLGSILWNSSFNRSNAKVCVTTTKNLRGAFEEPTT